MSFRYRPILSLSLHSQQMLQYYTALSVIPFSKLHTDVDKANSKDYVIKNNKSDFPSFLKEFVYSTFKRAI